MVPGIGINGFSWELSCFAFLLMLILGVLLPELNSPAMLLRLLDAEFAKLIFQEI
jgi:hypothetical protein